MFLYQSGNEPIHVVTLFPVALISFFFAFWYDLIMKNSDWRKTCTVLFGSSYLKLSEKLQSKKGHTFSYCSIFFRILIVYADADRGYID